MIEKAYAKVNLFLNVVSRREDGYHELNMVTHPIELHDVLEFEESDKDELIGSDFEDDLVLKAIALLRLNYKFPKVKITIKKNIPVGAGLGGGSADAAATLRGINKLFNLGIELDELAKLGIKIGADVPICLYNRPAVVKGIGEKIDFIEPMYGEVLLVIPDEHVSTKEVFMATNPDNMEYKSERELIESIKENDVELLNKEKQNDLEEVTVSISNKCLEIQSKLKIINRDFMMTGSGAVFYNVYDEVDKLKQNAKELDRYAINWTWTKLH